MLTALLLLTQNVAVEHKIIIKQKKSEKKNAKRICFIKINFPYTYFFWKDFFLSSVGTVNFPSAYNKNTISVIHSYTHGYKDNIYQKGEMQGV